MKLNKKLLFKILSGNAFAQIFVILTLPFLTRLFTPQQFGEFGLINGFLLILGVIGCFRYDQIMFNFNEPEKWIECFSLGILFSLLFSFFVLIFIVAIDFSLDFYSGFYFLPFALLLFSLSQLYSSILSVNKKYLIITNSLVIKVLFTFVGQLFFGIFSIQDGLVYGLIIGLVFQVAYMLLVCRDQVDIRFDFSLFKLKEAALSSVQSLFNSFSSQLPTLFIPFKYGFDILGYYSMALRLTYLPITFISNALRPFILGELNDNRERRNEINDFLVRGSLFLLLLACIGCVLISLFAKDFFVLYAGNEWAESGDIASIISIWVLSAFSNIIATSFLTVYSKFKQLMYYDTFFLFARFVVVAVSFVFEQDFYEFIINYSLVGMFFNLFIIFYSIWLSRNEKDIYRNC